MAPGDTELRQRRVRGNRAVLLGLLAVFVVPILIAYALNVWWPHWSPFGRTNHGEIVEPPWKLEFAELGREAADRTARRWVLLHPVASQCGEDCEALLDLTRRVHISLGKDHDRVARLYVHRAGRHVDGTRSMDAGLILAPAPSPWFDRFSQDGTVLLVIDPQRQAVLQYRWEVQGKGLTRDLARMLKLSKIG